MKFMVKLCRIETSDFGEPFLVSKKSHPVPGIEKLCSNPRPPRVLPSSIISFQETSKNQKPCVKTQMLFLRVYPQMIFPLDPPFTLWLFNIAMEHGPFIDGLPIKNGYIFHGKLLVITRWYHFVSWEIPKSNG